MIGLIALVLAAVGWGVWVWNHWGERRQGHQRQRRRRHAPGSLALQAVARPSPRLRAATPRRSAEAGAPDATGDAYRPASERQAVGAPRGAAMTPDDRSTGFEPDAETIADHEREIQAGIDAKAGKAATGRGQRRPGRGPPYPAPPISRSSIRKPGDEAALDPAPLYDAPFWRGSGKLEGFAAIVTGGDSGIGRDVAVLFAREGCDVAICHLDEDADAEETRRYGRGGGPPGHRAQGRRIRPGLLRHGRRRDDQTFEALDVVVPNAAFQQHVEAFEDLTFEQFDRTMKTNLYGYFNLVKAAVPHMKSGGAIVMTGSVTGILGNENLLDYSLTKGGIHAFARSLGTRAPRGIRVNVVAPGPVWTPLNPADQQAEKVAQFGARP